MTYSSTRNRRVYTLLEIAQSIQRAIQNLYNQAYWIKAEMHKLNHYKYSGHCYPDLLEKQEGKIVAQMRATLWDDDYQRINRHFLEVLGEPLRDGINILFLGKLNYSPVHGLSINILDIDPSFTLGDLEREKQETIRKLKAENLFELNKRLITPPLLKRLAIISVETSRGLSDFRQVIENNPWNYRFEAILFPALLQGDKAPESIITQLNRIKRVSHFFDAVAIIRGGGGEIGLSSYNNYDLAKMVATFPLPVITGIGHSTNETVVEMVAYHNAITPTALAEYLLQRFKNFDVPLDEAIKKISHSAHLILLNRSEELMQLASNLNRSVKFHLNLHEESISGFTRQILQVSKAALRLSLQNFHQITHRLKQLVPQFTLTNFHNLIHLQDIMIRNIRFIIKDFRFRLEASENQFNALHPANILKRGFSITIFNGKSLTDANKVQCGDQIETILYHGKLTSKVTNLNPDIPYE